MWNDCRINSRGSRIWLSEEKLCLGRIQVQMISEEWRVKTLNSTVNSPLWECKDNLKMNEHRSEEGSRRYWQIQLKCVCPNRLDESVGTPMLWSRLNRRVKHSQHKARREERLLLRMSSIQIFLRTTHRCHLLTRRNHQLRHRLRHYFSQPWFRVVRRSQQAQLRGRSSRGINRRVVWRSKRI